MLASAALFALLGAYLAISAMLVAAGAVSFTTAAWLLGGMETMGPVLYAIAAAALLVIAFGLAADKPWARHVALVISGVVFVLTIPTISGAVALSRAGAMVREGLKLIACVLVFRALYTSADAPPSVTGGDRRG